MIHSCWLRQKRWRQKTPSTWTYQKLQYHSSLCFHLPILPLWNKDECPIKPLWQVSSDRWVNGMDNCPNRFCYLDVCAHTHHLDHTEGQMDAFHALQPCLLELMREMLAKTFPPHEMRLYADRQWQLIKVEVLLPSPHFSTCSEEEVVAFIMAVLANAQNARVGGWTSANAFQECWSCQSWWLFINFYYQLQPLQSSFSMNELSSC